MHDYILYKAQKKLTAMRFKIAGHELFYMALMQGDCACEHKCIFKNNRIKFHSRAFSRSQFFYVSPTCLINNVSFNRIIVFRKK